MKIHGKRLYHALLVWVLLSIFGADAHGSTTRDWNGMLVKESHGHALNEKKGFPIIGMGSQLASEKKSTSPALSFGHGDDDDYSDECDDKDCDLDKNKPHRRKCCPGYRCVRKRKRGRDEGECKRTGGNAGSQPGPSKPRPPRPKPIPSEGTHPVCAETYCDETIACCRGDCQLGADGIRKCRSIIDWFPRPTLPSPGIPGTGGIPGCSGGCNGPVQDQPSTNPPPAASTTTTTTTKRPRPSRPKPTTTERPAKPSRPTKVPPSRPDSPDYTTGTEIPIIHGSTTKPVDESDLDPEYGGDGDYYDYIDERPNGGVGVTEADTLPSGV